MTRQRGTLVLGATGLVGRQVVAGLLEAGAGVRALVRNPGTACLPDDVEVVRGDLGALGGPGDRGALRASLDGVEAVFLLWPFATAEGTAPLLDAVAARARRVVYLSSAAVREHERSVERMIERSGLEWTVLRPHAFAANTLRWAGQIRAEAVVREPYGAAAMPPLHERDLAAVAVHALLGDGHDGATYEPTGPETLTQAEQARVIGEVTGRPVRWEEISPRATRRRMLDLGWPPPVVDGVLAAQAALVTAPRAATGTVEKITGAPARTFRAWVADHADAFATP
ncbi:NmrA family NAD(P)-binding protein [Streptosporangium sp. DT93]|uniref:NmrA family NAD(P)-binding protein n=1 Tax=Streptosporangium sp. DT93 TaxID=3393428 RepID=UPI003CF9A695